MPALLHLPPPPALASVAEKVARGPSSLPWEKEKGQKDSVACKTFAFMSHTHIPCRPFLRRSLLLELILVPARACDRQLPFHLLGNSYIPVPPQKHARTHQHSMAWRTLLVGQEGQDVFSCPSQPHRDLCLHAGLPSYHPLLFLSPYFFPYFLILVLMPPAHALCSIHAYGLYILKTWHCWDRPFETDCSMCCMPWHALCLPRALGKERKEEGRREEDDRHWPPSQPTWVLGWSAGAL